jgi:dephospho-CoA kinase
MPHTRPIIGIAGGIGSGKSAVAAILAEAGCIVADSDEMGRAALRDPRIRETLVAWWGPEVLDGSGAVDRGAVARIVFADAAELDRLEALTHPWIEARRRAVFEAAPREAPAFVIDAPLLFEVGLDDLCDAIIFVEAPRELRLRRIQATRGWDEAELARREESQLPLDEKRSRADYVVRNDGDLRELSAQVHTILGTIVETRRT